MDIPILYCPKCGKKASSNEILCRDLGFQSFQYCYFLCHDCGLFYPAKSLNRKLVRQYVAGKDSHSFREDWRIVNGLLEESKKFYLERGWKSAVFKDKAP
jgi:hypothetical protein